MPKKAKAKAKPPPPPPKPKLVIGPPPKPKKVPPPPACFGPDDLAKFKEVFKEYDEENIDKIKLEVIPVMLRKLGFNPKTAEVKELFRLFLEDELVDTVEYHEFLFMVEAKLNWGDDFEYAVTKAFAALAHDDEETGIAELEILKGELFSWGEPFSELEFVDWIRLSLRDKTLNLESGALNYVQFIENMNARDAKFIKEPINFFKLDQKTLAELARKKQQEEREEQERKEAERLAREEAKRLKMIQEGLIQPD